MRLRIGRLEITPVHILIATGGLSLLAVLVIVAVMLPGRTTDTLEEPAPVRFEWATVDRLVLPDDFSGVDELEPVYRRPRREAWTAEQLDEFWLEPEAIGLDVLDETVEREMRLLFEEVP